MTADRIILTGLRFDARHGVHDEEKVTPQPFLVDLEVELDARPDTDDLATTVNYATLARQVADVVSGDPVDLIETLAERIAATCLATPGVAAVSVTVHKPQAPVGVPLADVAVRITRRQSS